MNPIIVTLKGCYPAIVSMSGAMPKLFFGYIPMQISRKVKFEGLVGLSVLLEEMESVYETIIDDLITNSIVLPIFWTGK